MSEEILYIDDGELVYYINENEFITCNEIPYPMLEGIKHLQQKVEQLENIRKEAIEYIENNKETREHYEPYGTPMGNPNYTTTHIFGYYELLDILNEGSDKNGNNTNKTSTRKTEK